MKSELKIVLYRDEEKKSLLIKCFVFLNEDLRSWNLKFFFNHGTVVENEANPK